MSVVFQVAVAVQVIDDFNEKVLSGAAVRVRIPGSPAKPIRKSEGYFVFTAGDREIRQILVESPLYHTALVDIEPGRLNPKHPVLKVRLQPNRLYAAPGGVTCLEGKAGPGWEIRVIPEGGQTLKLLYDYDPKGEGDGRTISLFQAEKKDLSGKRLAIRGKEQEAPEVFQVMEMTDREQGTCLMGEALKKGYKKAGASLFPVYTTTADEKGDYYLLLPGLEGKDDCPCRVRAAGAGKETEAVIMVKPGRNNRADWGE